MVTSFLLWFATLSHWLSLSVVVTGALITLSVFLRFVVMGSIRGADGFGTSAATIQSHDGGVVMRLKPSTDWPVNRLSARLFGAVSIAAFHHVLRSPWPWFADAFSRGGNIFGSDGCQETGPAVVVELDQDPREVELKRLSDSELLLDLPPRQSYPFVVAVMPAEESDLRSDMNVGSVGAVLAVVHVKDDVVALPTQILSVHLKHTDECQRSSTALGPVFVSEDDDAANKASSVCAVCQDRPVTRVILPCRHACSCGRCFERLRSCPMCRGRVESYFLLGTDSSQDSSEEEHQEQRARTWRETLETWNQNFARSVGLQENF